VTAMSCAELADVAPELALELLSGNERAAALAHLQRCESCQQLVSALTDTTDRMLLLAPQAEPPPGFERRVLAAVSDVATRAGRRPRRRALTTLALAAAAILMLVLVLGRSPQRSFAVAEMRTPAGEVVGRLLVEPDRPAALFMTLPGWSDQIERYALPDETYALRIDRTDQPPRLVPFDVEHDSSWGATLDVDPDSITSVAVVDSQGHVWCQAEL
jgi:hypothetical protein